MAEKDLIHLKGKGDPYSDKVRSKTKGSSSNKRKMAQLINNIPRMKPETVKKKFLELVANPETNAITIMQFLFTLKEKKDLSDALQIQLLGKMIQAHKAIHGTKQNIKRENVNESSNVSEELKKLLEETREGKI